MTVGADQPARSATGGGVARQAHQARRVFRLAFTIATVAALAGCGGGVTATPTLPAPTMAAVAATPTSAPPTAPPTATARTAPPTPFTPTAGPTSPPAATATRSLLPAATATRATTTTHAPLPPAARGFVPILCYHSIRDWEPDDGPQDRPYITPPADFEEQLRFLKERGYQSVTAEQVYQYYAHGRPLPDKPVMLTFDDNIDNHYTVAMPLLRRYGFTGTFFIMTVTIGNEGFMTEEQLKDLDRQGGDIQLHTWDHQMVTKYTTEEDWQRQLVEPKRQLEALLGHPTPFFSYPFGVYDAASAAQVKAHGYKGAFRLREVLDEDADPLFAIPRYIVNAHWTIDQFAAALTGE